MISEGQSGSHHFESGPRSTFGNNFKLIHSCFCEAAHRQTERSTNRRDCTASVLAEVITGLCWSSCWMMMLTLVLLPCWLFAYSALILQKLADYSTNLFLLCQGGVMRLLLFVCQSFVQLFCLSVCLYVRLSVCEQDNSRTRTDVNQTW